MKKFNTDQTLVIKWMQNQAPNITSLIMQKSDWYVKNHNVFWSDWYRDIFDLNTINEFGVIIWCEILGVPKSIFILDKLDAQWAYGELRQNYIYSKIDPALPDPNLLGGNFFGSGRRIIRTIEEARLVLKLRYAALVSDGRVSNINRMLNWIFNKGVPFDYTNKKMAYLTDKTNFVDKSIRKLGVLIKAGYIEWIASELPRFNVAASSSWQSGFVWSYDAAKSQPYVGGFSELFIAPDGLRSALGCSIQFEDSDKKEFTYENVRTGGKIIKNKRYAVSVFLKQNFETGGNSIYRFKIKLDNRHPFEKGDLSLDQYLDVDLKNKTVRALSNHHDIPTDQSLIGIKEYGDGWFRVWFSVITSKDYVNKGEINESKFKLIHEGLQTWPDGASFILWGVQIEELPNDRSYTGEPSPFFNTEGYEFKQTDVVINYEEKTLSFPIQGNRRDTSLIDYGYKVYETGIYDGVVINSPILVGIGDGRKRVFSILKPNTGQEPVEKDLYMEYRIGSGYKLTDHFFEIVNDRQLGIMPTCAGIDYKVIQL